MSHALTFTYTASQQDCLFLQSELTAFLASKRRTFQGTHSMHITPMQEGTSKRRSTSLTAPSSRAPAPMQASRAPVMQQAPGQFSPQARQYAPAPPRAPLHVAANPPIPAPRLSRSSLDGASQKVSPAISQLLDQVRKAVRDHGAVGIAGIGRKFRICDDDDSHALDIHEFKKAMRELGFHYNHSQVLAILQAFDTNGDEKIDYEEFLHHIRPKMSPKREKLVRKAFKMLDTDNNGVVNAEDIKRNYNARGDPRVATRQKNEKAVYKEFLDNFDVTDHNGEVGPDEFVKYYQGVSASIDDDSYFELMIRNAWHISGGVGQSQNTANKRVLVIHQDGSSTVEEIKNDLGLDLQNRQEIIKRLSQQGMHDVKDVKLYG